MNITVSSLSKWLFPTLLALVFISGCKPQEQAVQNPQRSGSSSKAIPTPDQVRQSLKDGVAARAQSRAQRNSSDAQFMCEGSITHKQRVQIPQVAKPPFKRYFKDPAFGSKVIRITNAEFGQVFKPPYSTMQAWNSDESLLLIYKAGSGGGHLLFDGHTYEPLSKLDIYPADIEEVFWSHTDPDEMYYVSQADDDFGVFTKINVRNGRKIPITDFREQCGTESLPTAGGDVHMQSLDDDLFGFRCKLDDGTYKMLSYRISTDETIAKKIGEGTRWEEWTAPTPAPSGKRFWYQGKVLGTDLTTIERSLDLRKFHEHSNIGLTHNGQDALYQTVYKASPKGCNGDMWQGVGHLVEHNLETGLCRPIINQEQGYPYTTSSTHVSSQSYLRPGWVAMSSIGKEEQMEFFTNGRVAPTLFSEIYLADTSPDNRVTCRLAHHRSFGKMAKKGGYAAYFGEPHATISPSGTRIVYGSDWYDSGSVDTYVVELPGYERPR